MKTDPRYYRIQTPEASMTIIGGELLPGDAGHVWITTPDGQALFQVLKEHVSETSRTDTVLRVMGDVEQAKGRN